MLYQKLSWHVIPILCASELVHCHFYETEDMLNTASAPWLYTVVLFLFFGKRMVPSPFSQMTGSMPHSRTMSSLASYPASRYNVRPLSFPSMGGLVRLGVCTLASVVVYNSTSFWFLVGLDMDFVAVMCLTTFLCVPCIHILVAHCAACPSTVRCHCRTLSACSLHEWRAALGRLQMRHL